MALSPFVTFPSAIHSRVWLALCSLLSAAVLTGCTSSSETTAKPGSGEPPPVGDQLFTMMPSSYTGVRFTNRIEVMPELNVFTYRNFYNGGGVATGDLNGDGLPELVLTANQQGSRLFLNRGRFRFQDVTDAAGVRGKGAWVTGVTMADVNGDGLLDIYVCHAGITAGKQRANELFINQGPGADSIPRFKEMAADYGLADEGFSTQAAFLDYDRDGKLDMFLINNSSRAVSSLGLRNTRNTRDALGGDKLFHNDGNGHFTDVSAKAGIFGGEIAFGLGLVVTDVNRDGWPDIYVSNDFFERDYLYINNHDGSFDERLDKEMPYASYFSMGADIADVNNDGLPDIYTTDMLPEDEYRLRTTSSFELWDAYEAKVKNGFHYQLMRNMLQINNGNGTFSDVGQLAGVARTDWSWSALIADLDLDGNKDIYVTNGIAKDVTSQDYIAFLGNARTMQEVTRGKRADFKALTDATSSTRLRHYAFRNQGNLSFADETVAWGLATPSFGNGASYADIDGDGDLDLVVNNTDDEAFVYRNNARALLGDHHFLQIDLAGEGANRFGLGAKVTVQNGSQSLYQELEATRGFQSSVDYTLTFGLGKADTVGSVKVEWPDGRVTTLDHVAADRRITIRQSQSTRVAPGLVTPTSRLFVDVTDRTSFPFVHRENDYVDFEREPLIPRMLSTEGPSLAVADVNADGLDDVFIGGAKNEPSALLIQRADGGFVRSNERLFAADSVSEDVGAVFFDANRDGRPDLYVVTGGSEYSDAAPALEDRLYLNDGNGVFRKAVGALPVVTLSGSRAAAADFDGDGAIDLFVGGRGIPGRYGLDPRSQLLRNDGRGHFTDVTDRVAPGLSRVGMVTDALWKDVDGDGRIDLVVAGEWMPITIFHNSGGRLVKQEVRGLEKSNGWWNRIIAGDFTGDGRVDFVAGNLGLNTRLQARPNEPLTMYVKDFANDGFFQQIITYYNHGKAYPLALRDELVRSLDYMKGRYPTFSEYAKQTAADVFPQKDLAGAVVKTASTLPTSLIRNNGDGSFTVIPLPLEAQLAPIYGICADDIDGDGRTDLLMAGNLDAVKPALGKMSASYGVYLRNEGQGRFAPVRTVDSGFFVPGQARDIQRVRTREGYLYIIARSNDRPLFFRAMRARSNR